MAAGNGMNRPVMATHGIRRMSPWSRLGAAVRAAWGPAEAREFEALRLLLTDGALARRQDAIAVLGEGGSILAANDAACRIFGSATGCDALVRHAAAATASGTFKRSDIAVAGEAGEDVYDATITPLTGGAAALVVLSNATRERRVHRALVESRQRYKDLVEISSDFSWETGADGRFAFVSPQGALGHAAEALLALDPRRLLVEATPDDAPTPFTTRERVVDAELWLRRADGGSALVRVASVPVLDPAGAWVGARGVCRDITRERERETSLARAQMRERVIAYVIRTIHDEPDPAKVLAAAAGAAGRGFGAAECRIYVAADDGGVDLAASFGRDGRDAATAGTGEAGLLADATRQGQTKSAALGERQLLCIPTCFGKSVNGAYVLAREVSSGGWSRDDFELAAEVAPQIATVIEQHRGHVRLEALSRTDELTKLLNRRAFFAELAERLGRNGRIASRADGRVSAALFFVDLDNFKRVNDVHGHQRGDEALVAVADLLRSNSRPGDLVARLGGDEFAIWFDRTEGVAAGARAEQLLAASASLRTFSGDAAHPLGISVGVAVVAPQSTETVEQVTARADEAMYSVKRRSKGSYAISGADGIIREGATSAVATGAQGRVRA
jgi:diguanylate cyclase (GGDEF)-like protein/PAS domain S-box-containing protein